MLTKNPVGRDWETQRPEMVEKKSKIVYRMEKFEELSFEEASGIDGGFILTGPLWVANAINEFCAGFSENIGPAFERARNNIQYKK